MQKYWGSYDASKTTSQRVSGLSKLVYIQLKVFQEISGTLLKIFLVIVFFSVNAKYRKLRCINPPAY